MKKIIKFLNEFDVETPRFMQSIPANDSTSDTTYITLNIVPLEIFFVKFILRQKKTDILYNSD